MPWVSNARNHHGIDWASKSHALGHGWERSYQLVLGIQKLHQRITNYMSYFMWFIIMNQNTRYIRNFVDTDFRLVSGWYGEASGQEKMADAKVEETKQTRPMGRWRVVPDGVEMGLMDYVSKLSFGTKSCEVIFCFRKFVFLVNSCKLSWSTRNSILDYK